MTRRGIVSSGWLMVMLTVAALAGIGGLMYVTGEKGAPDKEELVLYCAAGIKNPVIDAAEAFEKETGIRVALQFGGSGTLLTNLQVAKKGDLYLAADTSYIEIAREKELLAEAIPLAKMRPVIVVPKGNPKHIKSLDDLLQEGVTLSLANPDAASIGKTAKKILTGVGKWEAIKQQAKVFKPTVNEIALDVALGTVDASIIWDAVARQNEKLEIVNVPEFDAKVKTVTIGVLGSCDHSPTALKFARYLQAPSKGQKHFKKHGFENIAGDEWAAKPKLTLFSGGVNRLAIQDTLKEFEQREGVEINTSFNGCGILVGEINKGVTLDAYFACDESYMTQVKTRFGEPLTISETDMVIVTKADSDWKIESLDDLTTKGLDVGVANEKQSALGTLTAKMLTLLGLYDDVRKNVKVETPTADLLVAQLLTGSLDAVIVYRVNVSQVKEKVRIIDITQGDPIAEQPIAIANDSRYPYLTRRLVDALTTAKSQQRFREVDFRSRIENDDESKNDD